LIHRVLQFRKKGYVAWNNVEIFPGYKKRSDIVRRNATIKIERYKSEYSHVDLTSFIDGAIRSSIGNKRLMKDSYY
jgi:hypothetical protein